MDVRIGVTFSAKEIDLELDDDTDREELKAKVASALSDAGQVLWLTDRRGRAVGVASDKVAYVEIGGPESDRRIGFGA